MWYVIKNYEINEKLFLETRVGIKYISFGGRCVFTCTLTNNCEIKPIRKKRYTNRKYITLILTTLLNASSR